MNEKWTTEKYGLVSWQVRIQGKPHSHVCVANDFEHAEQIAKEHNERAALLAVLTELVEASHDISIQVHEQWRAEAAVRFYEAYEKARALVGERDTTDERGAVEGQD